LERARAAAGQSRAEQRAARGPGPEGARSSTQGATASAAVAASGPPAAVSSTTSAASAPAAPGASAPAGTSAASRPQQAELDSLLTIAAVRMQRGQLVEPAGDSARDYLARAAQLSPSDAGVVRARADLAAALVTAAGVVVKAGNVGASAALLDEARKLGARSDSLALVEAEVAAARAAQARQRQGALLAAARERLASGALIVPPGESALDQLLAAEADAPNSADVQPLWSELTQKITANAAAALAGGDAAAAQAWAAALARSGRDPANAEALRRQADTLRLRQQYLAAASPASELNLLSSPPPVYPREAQLDGTEGWVDLEFVVDTSGRPRDVRAVDGQPSGRFERAAVAAVAQYQYEPFKRDGEVFERRVRLRIRFTLQ
ncbi:MAG TPA: energy transducer TonB, partial [Gammaproteobacteria bacterium]|nr:energy transducer TonB [Gammaproteobacteria bacterium]